MTRYLRGAARAVGVLALAELLTRTVVAVAVVAWVAYLGSTEAVVGAITSNPLYIPRVIATTSTVEFFSSSRLGPTEFAVLGVYWVAFSASFRTVTGEWFSSWTDRLAEIARERYELASEPSLEELADIDFFVGLGLWMVPTLLGLVWAAAVLSAWYRVLLGSPVALLEHLVVVVPSILFAMWVGDVVLPELLNRTGFGRVER